MKSLLFKPQGRIRKRLIMLFDIDHIDPSWEEGRDYQLVCGLDIALNYRESDPSLNRKKQNMFLPYRGFAPVEPGEFCWFLDPDSGEWSWQEFLGEWWFDKARTTAARCNMDSEAREKMRLAKLGTSQSESHLTKRAEANSKALKGKPWSAARRAAHNRKFTKKSSG